MNNVQCNEYNLIINDNNRVILYKLYSDFYETLNAIYNI